MGIYHIDPEGSVTFLAANVWKPNGLAISPDQKTLYIVSLDDFNANLLTDPPIIDLPPRVSPAVHAYDLLSDGSLSYRKEPITFIERWGDGMTVDEDDNLEPTETNMVLK